MGALTVNTYLQNNPAMADKLAGVIYSAPFFGSVIKKTGFQISMLDNLAANMNEMVLIGGMQMHKICRDKKYMRQVILSKKSNPLMTASLASSIFRNLAKVMKNAEHVTYPYQMILGEKDTIVDNASASAWHDKTKSTVKQVKKMLGAYHELSKETNSKDFFHTVITFCNQEVAKTDKGFGEYKPADIKIDNDAVAVAAGGSKKRSTRLIILYFVIGLILAIIKRSKRLLLVWPALPFLKHWSSMVVIN